MKLFLSLITIALLSGCSTTSKKYESTNLEGACFVKWSKPEYKAMYKKGMKMSRELKSMKGLLFPVWQNQGIYVLEKIENTYLVKFDLSDLQGRQKVEELVKKNFFLGDRVDQDMMLVLSDQIWKVNKKELVDLVDKYERVDCMSYFSSQFM